MDLVQIPAGLLVTTVSGSGTRWAAKLWHNWPQVNVDTAMSIWQQNNTVYHHSNCASPFKQHLFVNWQKQNRRNAIRSLNQLKWFLKQMFVGWRHTDLTTEQMVQFYNKDFHTTMCKINPRHFLSSNTKSGQKVHVTLNKICIEAITGINNEKGINNETGTNNETSLSLNILCTKHNKKPRLCVQT